MKLTTTFNALKLAGACCQTVGSDKGYDKLSSYLGGADFYGKTREINLLTILESNGLDDALWCLRATVEDKALSDTTKRLIACDFAESVLHIYEGKHPGDMRARNCIEVSRKFAIGQATDGERVTARKDAAYAAAAYAAAAYAYAAARKAKNEQLTEILKSPLQGE